MGQLIPLLMWRHNPKLSCLWDYRLNPPSLKSKNNPYSSWSPPPPCYFKWNIDASVKDTSINSTIGGVLRDDKGDFICLFFSTYTPMEINNAEVFAILRAIQIILSNTNRLSSQNFIIESYSFNVVTRCNTPSNGPWNLKFQLNFIRNVLNNCPSFSIIHHVRSSSHVADVLPKQGLRWQDEFFAWIWTDQSFLLPL